MRNAHLLAPTGALYITIDEDQHYSKTKTKSNSHNSTHPNSNHSTEHNSTTCHRVPMSLDVLLSLMHIFLSPKRGFVEQALVWRVAKM